MTKWDNFEDVPDGTIVVDTFYGVKSAQIYLMKFGKRVYANWTGNPIAQGWIKMHKDSVKVGPFWPVNALEVP